MTDGSSQLAPLSVPLSVLDLAPVGRGSIARARRCAIRSSSRARSSDSGTRRHWVAEHHNMPGIASSSPAGAARASRRRDVDDPCRVGWAHAARTTRRSRSSSSSACSKRCIRVGSTSASGARRAPIRSPLRRCDARTRPSPPTSSPTSSASCSGSSPNSWPEGHPYAAHHRGARRGVQARRSGSSARARRARTRPGVLGMPFSFAYHFAPAALDGRARGVSRRVRAVRRSRRAVRDARRLGGVRGDRRARPLARGAGCPGVPPPAFGTARRVPDARGGGGVPVHAGRA